jgi:hypothetical protein
MKSESAHALIAALVLTAIVSLSSVLTAHYLQRQFTNLKEDLHALRNFPPFNLPSPHEGLQCAGICSITHPGNAIPDYPALFTGSPIACPWHGLVASTPSEVFSVYTCQISVTELIQSQTIAGNLRSTGSLIINSADTLFLSSKGWCDLETLEIKSEAVFTCGGSVRINHLKLSAKATLISASGKVELSQVSGMTDFLRILAPRGFVSPITPVEGNGVYLPLKPLEVVGWVR